MIIAETLDKLNNDDVLVLFRQAHRAAYGKGDDNHKATLAHYQILYLELKSRGFAPCLSDRGTVDLVQYPEA